MKSQQEVIADLPAHLRPFVAVQDYSHYTPRDQAVWRFLLHQLNFSLANIAHSTYREGLKKTGIGLESIPRIEEINTHLTKLGWQAVAVDGFLPPAVFMEFQARKVLAIALNIRSYDNMLYTPAPDIIHESAGHAPFLVDIDYAEFLQLFGALGMRALVNQHDMDIYEAVRQLSIVKENASLGDPSIADAQNLVEQLQAKEVAPSEANLLARLHWWTVEYGLVGDLNDYTIYGAGLLSSLSESQDCIDDTKVQKLPLTLDAVRTSYDITQPQPQLFVTESCRHLSQVLAEYGRHMCCQRGGASALQEAVESGAVNTARYNSGLQVSGRFSNVISDAVGNAIYLQTEGQSQLAYQNTELAGHGIKHHAHGFGSPVGKLRALERCLSAYTVDELKRHGIVMGQQVTLNYLSGIKVAGQLTNILRRDQKNILFTFEQCTVTDVNNAVLFDPSWGVFDMAVGTSIESVAGGAADQLRFPTYEAPSQNVTAQQDYDAPTQAQFDLYAKLRTARKISLSELETNQHQLTADDVELIKLIGQEDSCDWLLSFEALELASQVDGLASVSASLIKRLAKEQGNAATLIEQGLVRLGLA